MAAPGHAMPGAQLHLRARARPASRSHRAPPTRGRARRTFLLPGPTRPAPSRRTPGSTARAGRRTRRSRRCCPRRRPRSSAELFLREERVLAPGDLVPLATSVSSQARSREHLGQRRGRLMRVPHSFMQLVKLRGEILRGRVEFGRDRHRGRKAISRRTRTRRMGILRVAGKKPEAGHGLTPDEADAAIDITPRGQRGSSQEEPVAVKKMAGGSSSCKEHDARRLHYDFPARDRGRNGELGDPQGPSYDRSKRLAVQTETTPWTTTPSRVASPRGSISAAGSTCSSGTAGRSRPSRARSRRPMLVEGPPARSASSARNVDGDWHLVKTRGARARTAAAGLGEQRGWASGSSSRPRTNVRTRRVRRGRRAARVGRQRPGKAPRGFPARISASETGESPRSLLTAVGEPMLATAATHPSPTRSAWLFEVKYDGLPPVRLQGEEDVRLQHARGQRLDRSLPAHRAGGGATCRRASASIERRSVRGRGEQGATLVPGPSAVPSTTESSPPSATHALLGFTAFDLPVARRTGPASRADRGAARACSRSCSRGRRRRCSRSPRSVTGDIIELVTWPSRRQESRRYGQAQGLAASASRSTRVAEAALQTASRECAMISWLTAPGSRTRRRWAPWHGKSPRTASWSTRAASGPASTIACAGQLAERLEPDRDARPAGVRRALSRRRRTPTGSRPGSCAGLPAPSPSGPAAARCGARDTSACARTGRADGSARSGTATPTPPSRPDPGAAEPARPQRQRASRPGPKLLQLPTKVLFPARRITKPGPLGLLHGHRARRCSRASRGGRTARSSATPTGIDGEEWYQQNAPEKSPAVRASDRRGPTSRSQEAHRLRLARCAAVAHANHRRPHAAPVVQPTPPNATSRACHRSRGKALPDYVVLDPGSEAMGRGRTLVEVAHCVRTLLEALGHRELPRTSSKQGMPRLRAHRSRADPRAGHRLRRASGARRGKVPAGDARPSSA